MARGRAVGITRSSYNQPSLHGDYLKQAEVESADEETVEQKQSDQPEEDVTGLPISSDEDDSDGHLSDDAAEISPPTTKSRRMETENHAKSTSPPLVQFFVPPSAIPRKVFHSSNSLGSSSIALSNPKKRNSNMTEGDTEDELPDFFKPRKQPKKQYSRNRNNQSSADEKTASDTDGKSLAAKKGGPTFRRPRGSIMVSKVEQVGKVGTEEEKGLFKNPSKYMSHAGKSTPQKNEPKAKFLQPLVLLDRTPNARSTRANKLKKPETIETERQETTRAKFRQPEFHAPPPTSSIAASSLTPLFNDAASFSSFSSSPDSPEPNTLIRDFEFERSNISRPSIMAKCPVCNESVERSLLEEFNNGAHLQVRQQMRFCKAHRARTAQSQWDARGYPTIDWKNFDSRLAQYHGALDDVLKGRRQSYYRNAMKDHLKSGRNRTLQQCLISGSRMEGLELGYYGSRGGKLMMENIISHFSHEIRRRAASDSLVSTGGVSAFVQAVLTPELAVMLVKEDMKTDDEGARAVLRDSAEVGHLLNEEEDEVIQDPESEDEYGEEMVIVMDDDDNNENHFVVEEGSPKVQRKRKKRLQQQVPDKVNKQEQAARTQALLDEIFGNLSEDEEKPMIDPK